MILWCISIYLIKVNPGSLKTLFFQRGLCDFVDLTRCPLANFRSMRVRLSTFKYMYRDKQHVLQTVDTNNVHDLTQKRSINHAENEELTHFFSRVSCGATVRRGRRGPADIMELSGGKDHAWAGVWSPWDYGGQIRLKMCSLNRVFPSIAHPYTLWILISCHWGSSVGSSGLKELWVIHWRWQVWVLIHSLFIHSLLGSRNSC